MHKTLCTVADEGLSGHRGRGGVCMGTGMTNALFYGNGDTDADRYGTGYVRLA